MCNTEENEMFFLYKIIKNDIFCKLAVSLKSYAQRRIMQQDRLLLEIILCVQVTTNKAEQTHWTH